MLNVGGWSQMRVSPQAITDNQIVASTQVTTNAKADQELVGMLTSQQTSNEEESTKESYERAVSKLNEFMAIHNKNSKFVFHSGLDRYYVQVVDASTDEVLREIPPKKLLDVYYSMQKFLGKIVDETI